MKINISRHAQRRLKLYKIDIADVDTVITNWLKSKSVLNNRETIIARELKQKYEYPLKIVIAIEGSEIVLVTAYPVKKERHQ